MAMTDRDVEVPTRILIEGLLRTDGTVDGRTLYATADALCKTDQQVRLCIKRLVTEGKFTQEGRGRQATLRATPKALREMEPDVEFVRLAYRQDRDTVTPWGRVLAPGRIRNSGVVTEARDALRTRVVYLGGALVQGGLYVSPHAWEPYIRDAAAELDVEQHLSSLTTRDLKVGTLEDPVKIAAQLWPLDQIADGYGTATRRSDRTPAQTAEQSGYRCCHDDHRTRGGIHASHGTGSAVAAGTTAHQLDRHEGSVDHCAVLDASGTGGRCRRITVAVPPVRRCNR